MQSLRMRGYMQEARNMPIGVQDFEIMRTCGYVYVDKSQFIPQLEVEGRAHFLSRPRRFGKSLFVSMLESYFLGKKELFKGLAIEKIKAEKNDEWQSYPVLKLDLNPKEYTEKNQLKTILDDHIDRWKRMYGIECAYKEPDSAFAYIIEVLYKKFEKRVVILIDEYDKPLIATLENEELQEQYRSTLKAFYGVIKSMNGYIHFSFLTGVTKFSKVSVFSDLNNLYDISFDEEYSSICGITEDELKINFAPEIQALANKCNESIDDVLNILRNRYDGYRFSKKEMRMYNPFSICNVFAKKELGNYWFETGTPTFLVRLFENHNFNIADLEGNIKIALDNLNVYGIAKDSLIPFLFQAGYLTIKKYELMRDRYILGFPNDEVRYAFLKNLLKVYTTEHTAPDGTFIIDEFLDSIEAGDIDRFLQLAKALIASIPYDSFSKEKLELREHNYQMTIYMIFKLLGQYVNCEVHGSNGRSDVEVETKKYIYIFEFKMKGKPEEAIEQIKSAGYAEKHLASSKNIFLIGTTFSPTLRTIDAWKIEKL